MRKVDEAEPPIGATEGDDVPLLDNPDAPIFYVDGIADIEIHDPNVRVTYYETLGDGIDEHRVTALVIIRPLASCHDGVTLFQRRVSEKARRRHH